MRIRSQQREQIRAALIAAGVDRIAKKGLARTTIEEITTAAGVAKGTFYNYFRSKEDLIRAAVALRQENWKEELDALMKAHSSTEERLYAFFDTLTGWIAANPEIAWAWSMERVRTSAASHVPRPGVLHQVLERILEAGREAGELEPDRPVSEMVDDLQGLLLIHFGRWYMQWRRKKPALPLPEALRRSLYTYLHGALSARGKSL